ncbi:hypothetical protein RJ639_037759 [Escallonia herrerae]|uniref:Knottins-like domain-containing protein n=1 Tax=Escallonia herrerae TaxID=1293975 RepID=A0AA88WJ33_9ASTE|nr:hypothetical protein RJ639_037759 [Escallonia herrerae]
MAESPPPLCRKRSTTWSGPCLNSNGCKDQCIRLEKPAVFGACHRQGIGSACFCYYNWCNGACCQVKICTKKKETKGDIGYKFWIQVVLAFFRRKIELSIPSKIGAGKEGSAHKQTHNTSRTWFH